MSSSPTTPFICIAGAIRQEIAGIRRRMMVEKQCRFGRADVWVGTWEEKRVVLLRTGMGKIRARETLSEVMERYPVSLILSTGYAGGLDPALKVGDLVVADKVVELAPAALLDAVAHPAATEIALNASLVERTGKLAPPAGAALHRGTLLTVDQIVTEPRAKKELGTRFHALAVDMETSALAGLAGEKNIPFLSIRAVTDTVNHQLLKVTPMLNEEGEVSKLRAGWYVLTHPGSVKDLNTLRLHANWATAHLTAFIATCLKGFNQHEVGGIGER